MRRRRPINYGSDPQLLATARLVENLAYLMPAVREHAALEVTLIDGAPTKTPGATEPSDGVQRSRPLEGRCRAAVLSNSDGELVDCGRTRPCAEHDSPVVLTSVESAVEARLKIERWLADVEAQCTLIAVAAKQALDDGRRLVGTRLAQPHNPQCRDGLVGKDGAVEWGDPLCMSGAEKSGLCGRHYMAWYRWRKANGVAVDGMFEPAAEGVVVTGSDQG